MSKSAFNLMVRVISNRMAEGETFEEIVAGYSKLTPAEVEALKNAIDRSQDERG